MQGRDRWAKVAVWVWVMIAALAAVTPGANAQTCGERWLALREGTSAGVWASVLMPNGDVVVGGAFNFAGNVQAGYIARWNGAAWTSLGSGMNGPVYALAVAPNGDLIAGGSFGSAGGTIATNIARWNGAAWSALGTGVDGTVRAIAVMPNGDVIAGGSFNTAGGTAAARIARWNGSAWSALGSGANGTVYALLALPSGDVVAGGTFTAIGSAPNSYGLGRWNGSAWSTIGGSVGGEVYALAVHPNGDLIAGGYFFSVGSVTAYHLARWNGSSWAEVGGGMDDAVNSVVARPNGDILVGGFFTGAGFTTPANFVARWNGTTWSAPGGGLGGTCLTLTSLPNGETLAGGFFSTAGSITAANVARFSATGSPTVAAHPASGTFTPGGTLTLSATPAVGYSNVSVQWQRNGVNISNGAGGASTGGGTVSGASGSLTSPTSGTPAVLTIANAQPSDAGQYRAVFSNACGAATTSLASVTATITVTGRDFRAKYGVPLWVQTIGTAFGDSTLGSVTSANGSEIDGVYARIANGRLYVGLAGNLESNGNSMVLAVDFAPTGSNVLALPSDSLLSTQSMNGLRFDNGFTPEVVVAYSVNSGFHAFSGALNGSNSKFGTAVVLNPGSPITGMMLGTFFEAVVNNSNTAGVAYLGQPFVGPPSNVDTGVEFSVPLAQLGWNGISPVRISGFVNGQGNNFLSNQVLGGLPTGTGNLGGDGRGNFTGTLSGIDFGSFAGTQFVSLVGVPTVPIGNPGNAADATTGFGAVPYAFEIGTTEVTNAQYAAFLNAVATSDPNGLYNTGMAGSFGGITRAGVPGSYTYATIAGRENHPVNFVSFWDACRFANWLHNGQPNGPQSNSTTEDGAYTLTAGGISANTVTRNAGWQWAVTSEDEWYKAAYHQPASAGGDSDNYWLYPTSSSSVPTTAQMNSFGSVFNAPTQVALYAANFYGTFDMGGNVWEWNESRQGDSAQFRGVRGCSFNDESGFSRATYSLRNSPFDEDRSLGFRISRATEPPPGGAPNLRVVSAVGPSSDIIAVAATTVSVPFVYNVENLGPGAVSGSAAWSDAAYLSLDTTPGPEDFRVGLPRTGPVVVSGGYSNSGTLTGIPPGTYNLIIRVNDNAGLDEGGQTGNNTFVLPTQVRVVEPVIDLVVATPAVSPLPVMDLYPVTVSANVTTSGTNVASSSRGTLTLVDRGGPGGSERQTLLTTATLSFTGTSGPGATQTLAFSGVLPVSPVAPASIVASIDQLSTSARNDNPANNSGARAITVVPAPDLAALQVIFSPTTILEGTDTNLSGVVQNVSTSALAMRAWTDRVYLSLDDTPSADDVQISVPQNRSVAANGVYPVNTSFGSTVAPGRYFVILVANADSGFAEGSRSNNSVVATGTLTISQRSNLRPTEISLPGGTDLPQNSAVTVQWTDRNDGPGVAPGPWNDRVVLSRNAVFGDADDRAFPGVSAGPASLDAGQGVPVSTVLSIPIDPLLPPGEYSLFVQTNVDRAPLESDFGDNVSAPVSVQIVRPPSPNLAALTPSAPVEAIGGQTIQVCWSTENRGEAAARGPWLTRVYLSLDASLSTSGADADVLLDEFPVRPPSIELEPGQRTSQCELVALPKIVGERYLIVQVNADGAVQEYLRSDDNQAPTAMPISILPEPAPDLTVPTVSPLGGPQSSVFAGSNVPVTFRVLNDAAPSRPDSATGPTSTPVWIDRVYLSPGNAVRDAGDVLLGSGENLIFLRPGESYTQSLSVRLPADLFGSTFHLIAETDVSNSAAETNESNNRGASPAFEIRLAPQPDLVASEVSSPLFNLPSPVVATGQPLQITWGESNSAAGERSGGSTPAIAWSTRVYLSRNADPLPPSAGDIVLGEDLRPRSTALASGAADPSRSATFGVPGDVAGGAYYLKVLVDSSDQVTERTLENNNVAVSDRTLLVQRTAPNLVPTLLQPAVSALPGGLVLASYAVENRGDPAPDSGRWTDRLVLSSDRTIDSADVPLSPDIARASSNLGTIEGTDARAYQLTQSYRVPGSIAPGLYWVGLRVNADNTLNERSETLDGRLDNELVSSTRVEILARYADLSISTPSASTLTAAPGALARVDWTVTNAGDAVTHIGQWTDEVVLSTNETFQGRIQSLATVARSGELAPGSSYAAGRVVSLPTVAGGAYFIVVRTDTGGAVPQVPSGGAPDTVAIPITITGEIADLVVSSVSAAPESLAGGERLTVSWSVSNTGSRATLGNSWLDRVEVRPTGGGAALLRVDQTRVGALAPQGGYQREVTFDLPLGADGPFDVVVRTDAGGTVPEADDTNNSAADSIHVTAALPANLVAESVSAPGESDAGTPIAVSWSVLNDSDEATRASVWTDEIWLSRDSVINSGDQRLLSRAVSGGLGPRARYASPQIATVVLPVSANGSYRLLLRTNADGQVYERALTSDNVTASGPLNVRSANLTALGVEPQSSTVVAGRTLTARWSTRNTGAGRVPVASWRDSIYLSRNQSLDGADILLGSARAGEALAPNADTLSSGSFRVPVGLSGPYFVLVTVNADRSVPEHGADQDNTVASATLIDVTLPEPADLIVTDVAPPALAQMGLPAEYAWRVGNAPDAGGELSGAWEDSIFLSRDATWDPSDVFVGRFPIATTSPLAPGESLLQQAAPLTPAVLPGEYFAVVRGDSRKFLAQSEASMANDDAPSPTPFPVTITQIPAPGEFSSSSIFTSGADTYFAITNVQVGQTLRIGFEHASPNALAELYVAGDRIPTPGAFDLAFDRPGESVQGVVIPLADHATYYVLARAAGETSPASGTVRAEYLPFQILSVSTTSVGAGEVSLRLRGAQMPVGTAFTLTPLEGGNALLPVRVTSVGVFEFMLTFDLTGRPGVYALGASLGALSHTFPEPITVSPEGAGQLAVEVAGVSVAKVGVPVDGQITVVNTGNIDVQVGELIASLPRVGAEAVTLVLFPGDVTRRTELRSSDASGAIESRRLFLGRVAPHQLLTIPYELTFDSQVPTGMGIAIGGHSRTRAEYEASVETVAQAASLQFRAALLAGGIDPEAAQSAADEFVAFALAGYASAVESGTGAEHELGTLVWSALAARPRPDSGFFTEWLPEVASRVVVSRFCDASQPCDLAMQAALGVAEVLECVGCVPAIDPRNADFGGESLRFSLDVCSNAESLARDGSGRVLRPALPGECWPPPVASYDPNQTTGPGVGGQRWISPRRRGVWSVTFQNDSQATAPAGTVQITTPMSNGMQVGSYRGESVTVGEREQGVSGNAFSGLASLPDLPTESGESVTAKVSTSLRPGASGGFESFWQLVSIDPSIAEPPTNPFSGFLPRESPDLSGTGTVRFSVLPAALPTGTRFETYADIVFDDNPPIRTNTVFNTIDSDDPVSSVPPAQAPPRALEGRQVVLGFAASDVGSGLQGVRVLVQVDGGPYRIFQPLTTSSTAVFDEIEPGRLYGFATQAVDLASNIEPLPLTPDATTVVPTLGLNPASDTGQPGDLVTASSTPAFDVVSMPESLLPVEILRGTTVVLRGEVRTNALGRGTFTVPAAQALIDGTYTVQLLSEGVTTPLNLTIASAAPQLRGWSIARTHGPAGETDLPVPIGQIVSEPREAGIGTLRVDLTSPIDPASVTAGALLISAVDPSGAPVDVSSHAITISIAPDLRSLRASITPPLTLAGLYCFQLADVRSPSGTPIVAGPGAMVAVLRGDVNGDQRTNANDLAFVRAMAATLDGAPIDPTNLGQIRADVDHDGDVDNTDVGLVRSAPRLDLRGVRRPCASLSPPYTSAPDGSISPTRMSSNDAGGGLGPAPGHTGSAGVNVLPLPNDRPRATPPRLTAALGPALAELLAPEDLLRLRGQIALLDRTGLRQASDLAREIGVPVASLTEMPSRGWWIIDTVDPLTEPRVRERADSANMYTSPMLVSRSGTRMFVLPRVLARALTDEAGPVTRAMTGEGLVPRILPSGWSSAELNVRRSEELAGVVQRLRAAGVLVRPDLGIIAPAPAIDAAPRTAAEGKRPGAEIVSLGLEGFAPSAAIVRREGQLRDLGLSSGPVGIVPRLEPLVFAGARSTLVTLSDWLDAAAGLRGLAPGVLLDSTGVGETHAAQVLGRSLANSGWLIIGPEGAVGTAVLGPGGRVVQSSSCAAEVAVAAAVIRERLRSPTAIEILAILERAAGGDAQSRIDPVRGARLARPQLDLDGDGRVTLPDLITFQGWLGAQELARADLNGDGAADEADATLILQATP